MYIVLSAILLVIIFYWISKKKYEKTLTLMEPKEWYKASELLNELEEKGVTKGKCYGKK